MPRNLIEISALELMPQNVKDECWSDAVEMMEAEWEKRTDKSTLSETDADEVRTNMAHEFYHLLLNDRAQLEDVNGMGVRGASVSREAFAQGAADALCKIVREIGFDAKESPESNEYKCLVEVFKNPGDAQCLATVRDCGGGAYAVCIGKGRPTEIRGITALRRVLTNAVGGATKLVAHSFIEVPVRTANVGYYTIGEMPVKTTYGKGNGHQIALTAAVEVSEQFPVRARTNLSKELGDILKAAVRAVTRNIPGVEHVQNVGNKGIGTLFVQGRWMSRMASVDPTAQYQKLGDAVFENTEKVYSELEALGFSADGTLSSRQKQASEVDSRIASALATVRQRVAAAPKHIFHVTQLEYGDDNGQAENPGPREVYIEAFDDISKDEEWDLIYDAVNGATGLVPGAFDWNDVVSVPAGKKSLKLDGTDLAAQFYGHTASSEDAFAVCWTESKGREMSLVHKGKTFKTKEAMDKFIEGLEKKPAFQEITATSTPWDRGEE